jgi:hypothetical protein
VEITLKNLKIVEDMSEETVCFTAILRIDGVEFDAENRGFGRANTYTPTKANKVENWRGVLEDAENYCRVFLDDGAESLDFYLNLLMEAPEKSVKALKAALPTTIFAHFEDGLREMKLQDPSTMADVIKKSRVANPNALILNGLPFNDIVVRIEHFNFLRSMKASTLPALKVS